MNNVAMAFYSYFLGSFGYIFDRSIFSFDSMSSRASDTAIEEKSIEATTVVNEPSKNIEWKEPPDGGWKAWLVVFGAFCVCFMLKTERKQALLLIVFSFSYP